MVPDHMSFSALSQYEQCPRAYYLSRIQNAEPRQTWFFPLGTAVHSSIESFIETGDVPEFENVFYPLIAEQMKVDPSDEIWLSGGPLEDPTRRERAVEIGKACVENAVKFLSDVDVWEVEYDASEYLPGCEVQITAYVDVIGEHKKHGPLIVDWKTGKSKPKDSLQLITYRALLDRGPLKGPPYNGWWGMLNPNSTAKTWRSMLVDDLLSIDASDLGARYQRAYDAIKERKWMTKPGFHCKFCIQSPNCLVNSGSTKRALYYDRAHEDGYPF